MKKIYLILSVLLCFFAANVLAQSSPGYMGKKFLLEYKYEFNELVLGDNSFNIAFDEKIKRLDNFEFGYVLTRGTSIGLRYSRMSRIDSIGTNGFSNKYQIIGLNSYFHYFRSRGHMAPLGNFFNLEILYANFDLLRNNVLENTSDFGFGLGIGNRFILADWVSFTQELKYTHFLGYNMTYTRRSPEITIKLGLGILLF